MGRILSRLFRNSKPCGSSWTPCPGHVSAHCILSERGPLRPRLAWGSFGCAGDHLGTHQPIAQALLKRGNRLCPCVTASKPQWTTTKHCRPKTSHPSILRDVRPAQSRAPIFKAQAHDNLQAQPPPTSGSLQLQAKWKCNRCNPTRPTPPDLM